MSPDDEIQREEEIETAGGCWLGCIFPPRIPSDGGSTAAQDCLPVVTLNEGELRVWVGSHVVHREPWPSEVYLREVASLKRFQQRGQRPQGREKRHVPEGGNAVSSGPIDPETCTHKGKTYPPDTVDPVEFYRARCGV